jgi:uncharacterized protein
MSLLEISEDGLRGTVVVTVRVQPRASKNEIAGVVQGVLKIRLCAPAVENRANEALVEFLAEVLKRPKSAVRIQSGEHGRMKRVEIQGVTRQQILDLVMLDA